MQRFIAVATLVVVALSPFGLSAQERPVMTSLKGVHELPKTFILQTAELLSQELYGFRPTDDVRTAGQILAHIADAQYLFCSGAAGEANPNSEMFEQTLTAKADIVSALRGAFTYCDGVYDGMTDAEGAETVTISEIQMSMAAAAVLSMNTAHNYEHYGNLVTYMRINGLTPPSTQMQGG